MALATCLSVFSLASVTGIIGLKPPKIRTDRVLEYRLVSIFPPLHRPTIFKLQA